MAEVSEDGATDLFVRVLSSQIDCVNWSPLTRELKVRFHSSRTTVYLYQHVPAEVVANFVFAASPGRYLNQFIKPSYAAVKLEGQTVKTR